MPSPNDPTVADFLKVFTPGSGQYKNIGWLMNNVFCAQNGKSPTRPVVGIAGAAGGLGPQFLGTQKVTDLFTQLATSFPDLKYSPTPPHCYSDDQNTIIIQAVLHTGKHAAPWFAGSHYAYSKPLSDIEPAGKSSQVPTCAVFIFDPKATGDNKIVRLGIYMDRWQMSVDLWPGTPHPKYAGRPFPHP
jgi:hypothetical protein